MQPYNVSDLVVKNKKQLQHRTMATAGESAFKDVLCHFHVDQAHQGVPHVPVVTSWEADMQ